MKITIINGPNLNLLGERENDIYGDQRFEDYFSGLKARFPDIEFSYFQSNIEGEIITRIQTSAKDSNGIILNAGGYSHTSVAIADAIAAVKTDVVEVHISNIFAREEYRHVSLTGARCAGSISGFGLRGYELAVLSLIK